MFYYTIGDVMVEHTLLMQKAASGSAVKSSLEDFGFAVCEIEQPDVETEELATREWPGEDGEDVYISPDGQKLQAYDVEVKLTHKHRIETTNLLNGIGLGKAGWEVPYLQNEDGENVTAQAPLWNLHNGYMADGYKGVAATTGGIAAGGVILFKSEGWSLSAGKVYTLSFGIAVGADTDHVDVFLGKDYAWGNMATNFIRLTPKKGRTRYVLQFTAKDTFPIGDSLCVVFNINADVTGTGMADYPAGSGIELYDLKLEEGINDRPIWSPSPDDVDAGDFPGYRGAGTALRFLRDYLLGEGGSLKLYSPYLGKGRCGAYVKKFQDIEIARSNADEVLSVNVTFRVTDPKTEVKLVYVGD